MHADTGLLAVMGSVCTMLAGLHGRTRYSVAYPLLRVYAFVLLEEAIKPFERRSTAARMRRPGSSLMPADTGFICTVPAPALPPSFSNRLPLQDRMARLSTNSSHRLVPYTHDALVTDRAAAEASTQAIRDVVKAARFATALKNS